METEGIHCIAGGATRRGKNKLPTNTLDWRKKNRWTMPVNFNNLNLFLHLDLFGRSQHVQALGFRFTVTKAETIVWSQACSHSIPDLTMERARSI